MFYFSALGFSQCFDKCREFSNRLNLGGAFLSEVREDVGAFASKSRKDVSFYFESLRVFLLLLWL